MAVINEIFQIVTIVSTELSCPKQNQSRFYNILIFPQQQLFIIIYIALIMMKKVVLG